MTRPMGRPLLGLIGLALLLFFVNIWGYDLWPPDEPRFGQVAREMLQSGNFLAPHINGEPYKEKPPLLFWAICLFSLPFGDVTEFSARAPSALGALITVLCTYLLARRLANERVAFWSGVILCTTLQFWWEARTVHTDMLMTAALSVSMLALWEWRERRHAGWLILFYGAITAALYAKGPPALAFPMLAIVTFYWKQKEKRRKLHWLSGLAAAVALVLAWYIPARMSLPAAGGEVAGGTGSELYRQIIGRAVLGSSKAQPPWYYVENLPMSLFPWVIFLPWTAIWTWKRRNESPELHYLLSWCVPAFIFFSIVIGKRPYYLLPIYPALAIIFARAILDLMDEKRTAWIKWTAGVWAAILALCALAPLALKYTEYRDIEFTPLLILGVMLAGFAVNTVLRAFRTSDAPVPLHALISGHFTALLALTALIGFPMLNAHKSARAICEPLRTLSLAKQDYKLYSVGLSREEYIFYARHFHEAVLTESLDLPAGLTAKERRRAEELQYKTRRAIMKAVDQVPIHSFESVTPEEIQALDAKLDAAVKLVQVDPKLAADFETALKREVNGFTASFEGHIPAFMFVQEQDWRWLLPLHPEMRAYPVIGNQSVGSREMLLIANQAGAKLITSKK
ncbi:MAG: glycosyltransferase family 39 protein [Candidatus Hydrogenedentes bacterium]|nr:glycosyltransferase family 39 protein [Candidatus Hydrogenedentota bacterium]